MADAGERQELEALRLAIAERQRVEEEMRREMEELRRKNAALEELRRKNAALEKEKEVAQKEKEELRSLKEAAERVAEELRMWKVSSEKVVEDEAQRLLRQGFPALRGPFCSSSQSSASQNVNHLRLSFTSSDFHTVDLPLIPARSALWGFHDDGQLPWSTENDIQGYVKLALVEIIKTAGYAGMLDVLNELSMFTLRPDIWVVRSNGRPIGVCEVKRPNAAGKPSALLEPHLAGQIFDYMMRLR